MKTKNNNIENRKAHHFSFSTIFPLSSKQFSSQYKKISIHSLFEIAAIVLVR